MKAKIIVASLLLTGILFTGCLKDDPVMLDYKGITPERMNDGWEISTPLEEGFDPSKLDKVYRDVYDNSPNPNIRSLLVARNGKLIGEAYFKDPYDRERMHDIMSVTKSVTSLLAGVALEKGFIGSLNDPAYMYLSDYFDEDMMKREITLRQVLTMETGLEFDNGIHTGEMFNLKGSSLQYVLSKAVVYAPGTVWYYGDGNPQIISGIIQETTGNSLKDFADENLFRSMGISKYYWESHADGLTYGAFGLWLIPRDMAKVGQLMLDHGLWKGERLVPEQWVVESTKKQASSRDYGYYWYPENEGKTFKASGSGNQLIWVYPEKQLVVVTTSDSYARTWVLATGSLDRIFTGIVNAITD